jgi:hypothetical protein
VRQIFIFGFLIFLMGNASGYEAGPGSATAQVDVSYDRAYDAGLDGVRDLGGLSTDSKQEGWIKSEQDNTYVEVHIESLENNAAAITVSAKQLGLAKPEYAQDVLKRILKRIKRQPFWMR